MGIEKFNSFLGWVFIGGMVALLATMVVLMAMGLETWVIAWLTMVTASVIGMTAGMVVMIKSFKVEDLDEVTT
ncbi:MAG: hypothetical protein JSW25_05990 [Thermoplasmata archaeon]|nr:MAG: hypothetical protein JSW25_05990 [Thermoplasmata archaeon]